MWTIEPTTSWEREQKRYAKKRPDELAAVLKNLARYFSQLSTAKNPQCVQAGYIHHEPMGIVAIDQRGPGCGNLQETRLYIFPCEAEKVLYIITMGNKSDEPSDIEMSKEFVRSLKPPTP